MGQGMVAEVAYKSGPIALGCSWDSWAALVASSAECLRIMPPLPVLSQDVSHVALAPAASLAILGAGARTLPAPYIATKPFSVSRRCSRRSTLGRYSFLGGVACGEVATSNGF